MSRAALWCMLVCLLLSGSVQAQLSPDKALAAMKVLPGLQVELFAAEPMLINPTSIDVDHLGRVWVAEAVNYRRKNFNRPILREAGDRIVILIDKDGDGKADQSKVFYQGKDLYGPLSVCVIPQADGNSLRVLVAQSPDILEFWDRNGDLVADGPPTKFLSGFGGYDHDHGVHGLSVGPDGKLYFTVGDSGVTGLQSKDGTGKKWVTTRDPKGDCQAGTVWRCDLDGNRLELIAHNFRNNYEACVDSFGEVWLSDNDDDGNQQTRICFVMPGGNYGYWPRGAGQTHWHEEQPGIVHKTLRTGFGSPTGICFYEGKLLPEKYRGHLLHCDAGPREVRAFFRKPKGAGYELDKEVILTSTDNFFRPSDVCVAPDGSIFVADWYDRGVGGHGMGDPTDGRIYRITPAGHKGYQLPEVNLDTRDGAFAALGSPNLAQRAQAFAAMSRFKGQLPQVNGAKIEDLLQIARFLWIAAAYSEGMQRNDLNKVAAKVWVSDNYPDSVKAMVTRMLDRFGNPVKLETSKNPEAFYGKVSAAIRREHLLLYQHLEASRFAPTFYSLAKLYDGNDHFYRAALNIACGTDPVRREALLVDFDKHFPEWNEKVADLVWELRPKSVLPRLGKLLADEKTNATQKARIVDILASSDDSEAGKAMLSLLKGDSAEEVKQRALDNLRLFLPTKWNALQRGEELRRTIDSLLNEEKNIRSGLQLAAAANFVPAVERIEKIARNEKAATPVRIEAIRTLGKIKTIKAVEALIDIGQPENVLSLEVVKALGDHLPMTPKVNQTSQKALEALQFAITLPKASKDLKLVALSALAGSRAGTDWLLAQKEKNQLPDDLLAEAGRLLRNSPFQAQRNKALLLFPAPGKLDPKKLPAISELAKRSGSAERGKELLASSLKSDAQCLKCHMIRGLGGNIGPDLSMIGKKASKENLYESLLTPSKAIADQYIQWTVTDVDGKSTTGLLIGETPTEVILRDANGKDTSIAKKDIDSRKKSPASIMPDNLVTAFTIDELIDVVEYLQTLKTAALSPEIWSILGPFENDAKDTALDTDFGIEKAAEIDLKATHKGRDGLISWKQVRVNSNGYLDLAAHYGSAATNSSSYLLLRVESPVDQDATLLVGNDDGAKIWINGQQVFHNRDHLAATPAKHHVPVKLKKGINQMLVKIMNGNNPHGLYLSILSEQELKP